MRLIYILVVAGLLGSACKSFETNLQDTDVDYLVTARQNYEAGDAAFVDEDYNDAIKFFEYVKNKYPYSKYAVLADLRVADAYFEREEYVQAADAYRLFARYHPSHESVPYATFRTALAYHREIAADPFADVWGIGPMMSVLSPFPATEERDQTATHDSIRSFDEFLARYPDDENAEEARRLRLEAREKLAAHDLYAADFYRQRQKYRGAVWRHLHIASTYADTSLAPSSLKRAADIAEDDLKDLSMALSIVERIVKDYPTSDEAKELAPKLDAMRAKTAAKVKSDDEQKAARALKREQEEKKIREKAEAAQKVKDEANQEWVTLGDDDESDSSAEKPIDKATDNATDKVP